MNPWAIIAGLVLWAASLAGASWLGYDYRDGKVAQEIAKAQADTLENAINQADKDKAAAIERAKKEGEAAERARAVKSEGVNDAISNANPVCLRNDVSMRLLGNAIDAANGTSPATGGMFQGLRAPAKAPER